MKKTIEVLINGKKENEFQIEETDDYTLTDYLAFTELVKGWLFDKLVQKD